MTHLPLLSPDTKDIDSTVSILYILIPIIQVVERLQEQNQVLGEMAKVRENLKRVEQENLLLRSQLQSHGFEPIDYVSKFLIILLSFQKLFCLT